MAAHFSDSKAEAEHAAHGLAGMLARHTVAVIPDVGLEIGSGVLVSHEGELFVATARHVAEDLPADDMYCIPKPKGSLKIVPRDQVRERLAEVEPSERCPLPVAERILSSPGPDVALLRLRERPQELQDMEFYPLDRARSTLLPGDELIVYGFAWDLSLVHRPTGRGIIFPRLVWGNLKSDGPDRYDPDRDLLISYEDAAGSMKAHGMSGGGVWLPPRASEGALWNPGDLILAGIQVAQFPESLAPGRPLLATRIEHVKALLAP